MLKMAQAILEESLHSENLEPVATVEENEAYEKQVKEELEEEEMLKERFSEAIQLRNW